MSTTRVLIVDDSPLIRQILSDLMKSEPDIEVVGHARDGAEGVRLTAELRPDVVTMDVEMPKLNGLEALKAIMREHPTPVIMFSTLTHAGASATLQALELGAFDFLAKPTGGAFSQIRHIAEELLVKIRATRGAQIGRRFRNVTPVAAPIATQNRLVLVASSTGGPRALASLFEGLPRGLQVPFLIVQHMPAGFTRSLAERLDRIGTIPCREAKPGDKPIPGQALLAPGGLHMKMRAQGDLILTDDPPVHGVRPAADELFHTSLSVYGPRCLAVVLTGMGRDGAEGALSIHKAGGTVLAESERTCTVYGMPKAVVSLGAADAQVPIDLMAKTIVNAVSGRLAHAG